MKHNIPCTRLTQCEQSDMESLWLLLRPNSLPRSISSIILCAVYHSTSNGPPENQILCSHIQSNLDSLLIKQPNSLVIITGDFNSNSIGFNVTDLTHPNGLKQIVNFKTRDLGILDWFLTIRPSAFDMYQLPKIGKSDHFTILARPAASSSSLVPRKLKLRDLRDDKWREFGQ